MGGAPHLVLVFGDQVGDTRQTIKELTRKSNLSLYLRQFLEEITASLTSELTNLEYGERSRFPRFTSILDLAESDFENPNFEPSVQTVLLCIAQLGSLICRMEHEASEPAIPILLGICTGLLSAAAAAAATSIKELVEIAPHLVLVSLRLGVAASRRSWQIEQSGDSWAVVFHGISVAKQREEILGFNKNYASNILSTHQAYISAFSNSTCTISGPPSTLRRLCSESQILSCANKIQLPIAAAFHAKHLIELSTTQIVGSSSALDRPIQQGVKIFSTSSGQPYQVRTLREALQNAIDDILQRSLDFVQLIEGLRCFSRTNELSLVSIGPSTSSKLLYQEFENVNVKVHERSSGGIYSGSSSAREGSGDIAIVGMAGRFPGSCTMEEYWHIVDGGIDLHSPIPRERLSPDTASESSHYGCFLKQPGSFDSKFFRMSSREAAQTDPGQRLLLLTTYEALEMAGYTPNGSLSTDNSRIGTFFGQTIDDYREHNLADEVDIYYVTGGLRAFGPGRLNHFFKWEGPSYSVDTACSSGLAAVHLACSALLSRECDSAIAGGSNILTGTTLFDGLSRGGFLSPTGSCKSFDEKADGYCRADGVGSLVLKRLKDAIADNDNIQAVIKASATNHSARASSITQPCAETQGMLFRQLLLKSGLEASDVNYIEMHGTGTQRGDLAEFSSVTKAFGEGRSHQKPLHIGSVKPNIGHSEAAAGIASLLKAVLMLRKNVIPPHIGIKSHMNQRLQSIRNPNIHIVNTHSEFEPYKHGDGKRRIVVNNFGAAGGNTSLLLEDAPQVIEKAQDPRAYYVVAISAKSSSSLKMNLKQLLCYLDSDKDTRLEDLSYTSTARRMHYQFRQSYATSSITELRNMIASDLAFQFQVKSITQVPTSTIAFVFTGQGSQYSGMAGDLLKTSKQFRDGVFRCEGLCLHHGFQSWISVLQDFVPNATSYSSVQIQLAIVSLEITLAELWQSWGIVPDVVIGHSLGEYSALHIAGVLSLSDTLYLVGKRAELVQERCTANSHSMLAVKADINTVKAQLLPSCTVSCFNESESHVVSGKVDDIAYQADLFKTNGVLTKILDIPYAFHSPQMDEVVAGFEAIAQSILFGKARIKVASTLRGKLIQDGRCFSAEYLAQHMRYPVNFSGAVQDWKTSNTFGLEPLWIECGPNPVCLKMISSTTEKKLASLERNQCSWRTLTESLSKAYNNGVNVSWRDLHKPYELNLRLLELPPYTFDLRDYWLPNRSSRKGREIPSQKLPYSCLQKVEKETFDDGCASVVFASNLAEPGLRALVQGHLVKGYDLCPSSVYADMAFTAAAYIHSLNAPRDLLPAMDVTNMEISAPLIADTCESAKIINLLADKKGDRTVELQIVSMIDAGTKHHAHCQVLYGDGQRWMDDWVNEAFLVSDRMSRIIESVSTGETHKLLKSMIYKLFQGVVRYSPGYQCLQEVYMMDESHEAVGIVDFRTQLGEQVYTHNPYWIDSIAQLGGFVLNASPTIGEDEVFISTGWDSLRVAKPISPGQRYRSYVRMQEKAAVFSGDVYLFDEVGVVALCRGIRFRRMTGATLCVLLTKAAVDSRSAQSARQTTSGRPKDHFSGDRALHQASIDDQSKKQKDLGKDYYDFKPYVTRSSRLITNVLSIIANELRLEEGQNELSDDANFVDIGIDSILTIPLIAKLRAATGLDLSTSLFTSCVTVHGLKVFLSNDSDPEPMLEEIQTRKSICMTSVAKKESFNPPSYVTPILTLNEDQDVSDNILFIIASEIGIERTELQAQSKLSDLGLDSLLSISILTSIASKTGHRLPSNFFDQNQTPTDVCKAINTIHDKRPSSLVLSLPEDVESHILSSCPSQMSPSSASHTPTSSLSSSGQSTPFRSTPVLLQGCQTYDKTTLLLLPDGSGSARSYIDLPTLSSGTTVYALDSPFLISPFSYTSSFTETTSMYIDTIRGLQPHGPYILGGWSLGGIYAYEAARQLLEQGEEVSRLFLIDSPCPGTLPPLPEATLDDLESAGIFRGMLKSGREVPMATRQHFVVSVRALERWRPEALGISANVGQVVVIWGKDCVFEDAREPERMAKTYETGINAARDWLFGFRKDYGACGWAQLTGGNIDCHVVEGNHFSIMKSPSVDAVGEIIRKYLWV